MWKKGLFNTLNNFFLLIWLLANRDVEYLPVYKIKINLCPFRVLTRQYNRLTNIKIDLIELIYLKKRFYVETIYFNKQIYVFSNMIFYQWRCGISSAVSDKNNVPLDNLLDKGNR